MKLLAIDTTGEACSCALTLDGEISARLERAPRRHAELLLPMVESLLAEAGLALRDLDALAFGCGPGSFTGLRIAAGVAQGLGRGAGLAVVPVSSLRALAQGAFRRHGWTHTLCAFDARMGEVYAGVYQIDDAGLAQPRGEDRVCAPAALEPLPAPGPWHGAGSGWATYGAQLGPRLGVTPARMSADAEPDARDVATLGLAGWARGEAVAPAAAVPVYLRNQVALTRAQRAAG